MHSKKMASRKAIRWRILLCNTIPSNVTTTQVRRRFEEYGQRETMGMNAIAK